MTTYNMLITSPIGRNIGVIGVLLTLASGAHNMNIVDPKTIELGSVDTHKKASSIAFYNPANQPPYLNIVELTVDSNGTPIAAVEQSNYLVHYWEMMAFPLLNPVTGEPLGKDMAVDELMAIMYSLYVHVREVKLADVSEEPTP